MIQGQLLDAVGLLAGDASALVIVGVLLDDPALEVVHLEEIPLGRSDVGS